MDGLKTVAAGTTGKREFAPHQGPTHAPTGLRGRPTLVGTTVMWVRSRPGRPGYDKDCAD